MTSPLPGLYIARKLLSSYSCAYLDSGEAKKAEACDDAIEGIERLIEDEEALQEIDARVVGKQAAYAALLKKLYL